MKIKNFALWFIIQWMLTTLWTHASCWFYHNLWFITFISESWWITSMKIMLSVIYQLKARLLNRSLNLFWHFLHISDISSLVILGCWSAKYWETLNFIIGACVMKRRLERSRTAKDYSQIIILSTKNLTISQIIIQQIVLNTFKIDRLWSFYFHKNFWRDAFWFQLAYKKFKTANKGQPADH